MRQEKVAALVDLGRRLAASAEGLTLDDMAEAAGVSRRTAERMRDALQDLFPQMEAVADPPTKRFRIPGGLDGFAQAPTAEELSELAKAAEALRTAGSAARAASLEGLERKIRAALRRASLVRLEPDLDALARAQSVVVQAGPRPSEDPEVLIPLREALKSGRRIAFRYRGGRTPGARREATPYGLILGRGDHLVAADRGTAPRTFRLDRMEAVEVLAEAGAPPAGFDLQAFADRSFGVFQDEVMDVVLRVSPAGAEEALRWRFHASQTLERAEDGAVVVRFRASGLLELVWHLFSWGTRIEVLEPPVLRARLVEELAAALRHHGVGRAGPLEAAAEAVADAPPPAPVA